MSSATLDVAILTKAELDGARLSKAHLSFADLRNAQLQGANMASANLQAANLSSAQLNAADLSDAELQGADLRSAQLQGTDLRRAFLYQMASGQVGNQNTTNLGLSDLRGTHNATPPTDNEMKGLYAMLFLMPEGERKHKAIEQFDQLKVANGSESQLRFTANSKQQVLVSDPTNPIFKNIPTAWLIASPTPSYRSGVVTLLADNFASDSSAIATRIAWRVATALESGNAEDRTLYAAVACQLVANVRTHDVVLEPIAFQQLESECDTQTAPPRRQRMTW